jgi:hypothetical protein
VLGAVQLVGGALVLAAVLALHARPRQAGIGVTSYVRNTAIRRIPA